MMSAAFQLLADTCEISTYLRIYGGPRAHVPKVRLLHVQLKQARSAKAGTAGSVEQFPRE